MIYDADVFLFAAVSTNNTWNLQKDQHNSVRRESKLDFLTKVTPLLKFHVPTIYKVGTGIDADTAFMRL